MHKYQILCILIYTLIYTCVVVFKIKSSNSQERCLYSFEEALGSLNVQLTVSRTNNANSGFRKSRKFVGALFGGSEVTSLLNAAIVLFISFLNL